MNLRCFLIQIARTIQQTLHENKRTRVFIFALLMTFVFCIYSASLGHNFLFDETNLIVNNEKIRDLREIPGHFLRSWFYMPWKTLEWNMYYRPLASVSLTIDYQLTRLNPLGYNFTNVLWHLGVCALLMGLLRKLLKFELLAFALTLLYAIHPAHTQAVTYVASRGDLMAAFFILAGIHFYRKDNLVGACLSYLAAVCSKENAIVFPAYALIWSLAFRRDLKITKQFSNFSWLLVTAISFVAFKTWVVKFPSPPFELNAEAFLRFLSVSAALKNYASAFFFPEFFKHSLYGSFAQNFWELKVVATLFMLSAYLSAVFLAWKKNRVIFFALCFFAVAFLPYTQLIQFHAEWSEHYLYIPMIGVFILIGVGVERLIASKRWICVGATCLLMVFFGALWGYRTVQRNEVFNNTWLYYDTLSQSDSPYAFIGFEYKAQNALLSEEPDEALAYALKADALMPYNTIILDIIATAYFMKEDYKNARIYFEQAYKVSGWSEKYLLGIANTELTAKKFDEAIEIYKKIIDKKPDFLSAYIGVTTALELAGKPLEAMAFHEQFATHGKNPENLARNRMLAMSLAYRILDKENYQKYLNEMLSKNQNDLWYGDTAKMLSGLISVPDYLAYIHKEIKSFDVAALRYAMMKLTQEADPKIMRDFLDQNLPKFDKLLRTNLLLGKEIELAQRVLQEDLAPTAKNLSE